MKIILITGMSGSGKTSICKNLCQRFPNKYHFVNSFTDRQKREKDEWGHEFITSIEMDSILQREDVIAQTKIDNKRYCTIKRQFEKNKTNLYIVDVQGINDTLQAFSEAEIMIILVRRKDIEADCVRINRDVNVPIRDDVDFLIDNNGTIESAANLLNTLANFDFFTTYNKNTKILTLNEKIDYIDEQYRFLNEVKESLYEQMWYNRLSVYRALCKYVEDKVNEKFDFHVDIEPDASPEIFDGYLTYNVQGCYDDDNLGWDEINRLVECLSYYSHKFCDEHDCDDIMYRLSVSEHWNGEDKYL